LSTIKPDFPLVKLAPAGGVVKGGGGRPLPALNGRCSARNSPVFTAVRRMDKGIP